jgi:hypothetical protein
MEIAPSSNNILNLADSFIEQMLKIKNMLRAMSISGLILAAFAMGLTLYLVNHASFFNVLQSENEFGFMLSILLASIFGISSVWIITAIRQYNFVNSWNERYHFFIVRKEEIDKKIATGLALDRGIEEG